jgi:hypothetical protein
MMSNEIEHPQAYYRDLNGVLQVIEAESLSRPEVLEIARVNYLTDEDEQFRDQSPYGLLIDRRTKFQQNSTSLPLQTFSIPTVE